MRVLIVGAGGHAQVIADVLLRMRDVGANLTPIGYLDDNPELAGQEFVGLPVLGAVDHLSVVSHDALIVAIGDNVTRRRLFETLQGQGECFVIARHPSAVIAPDVQIGSGSMICAGAVVNPGSVIGANVILNTGCTVDHHNHIGNHVHIAPGVHLGGDVNIGEGTLVGIGATVMPQRRVGDWSIVSAGALVHADLPDRVVVAGMPARVIRNLAMEG
ncbi:MAG: acetyltransferase [Chloroflexota bacterium]|nr:acetyltransferase [Chloroflexota bacterium]